MARPKTPKQLEISINSLKKQVLKLEAQRKRAMATIKKKVVKRKVVKKIVKRKPVKRKVASKKKR
ncbi:MAG: hypothetical protein QT05_C0019G0002 [archaeon GW2011_AR13]|nr:MAG: hypothetical protein QT05_C0019G0002 [archaeon GW2011_AR13]HIG94411.1 hypothetical protein [Nanoarchaeota archaeon]HIH63550.1 hypothetical protein [Nanoarchaeota archaeon]HIJ09351.1 hypothetical protein [Nanoarchaeota archaeon]HLD55348.1 hypothetical protein [Candidatus Nanoarchaeia archaeon]